MKARRLLVILSTAALHGVGCSSQALDKPDAVHAVAGAGGGFELGGTTVDCSAPGGAAGEGGASEQACSSDVAVSYAVDVAPILAHCVGEACHDFATTPNVAAWIGAPADECCNERALIAPGHPEKSYLIDKLRGRRVCTGERMPRGRAPLSSTDIATLEAWICQGASLR